MVSATEVRSYSANKYTALLYRIQAAAAEGHKSLIVEQSNPLFVKDLKWLGYNIHSFYNLDTKVYYWEISW